MASYAIFDEQYYLASYPWLKPAIDIGIIKSGREHFEKFGQAAASQKYRGILTKILTLREIQTLNPLSAQSTQTRLLLPD